MSIYDSFYYYELKKLPPEFFKDFDAHVRAGSKEDFINDIQKARESEMLPAFAVMLRHAIAVNEDILDCDFIPPDSICPFHFGELSDLIFEEMLKESKASFYLMNRLKTMFGSEMPYLCFSEIGPYLKLWRAAVFSENRQYFEIVFEAYSACGISKYIFSDSTAVFYLIRKGRREDIIKIADTIGKDELLSDLRFMSPCCLLKDNYTMVYYSDRLFDILIPEFHYSDDKNGDFCRLFEKYGIFGYLSKITADNSCYYYFLESVENKTGRKSHSEKKIVRMTAAFFRELGDRGYKLSTNDYETLLKFSESYYWNIIMKQEYVCTALKGILPEKMYLPYNSEVFSRYFQTYIFERTFPLLPTVVVFDEGVPESFSYSYSHEGAFSNILHKTLSTLRRDFSSIKTTIKGDMENIPIINEIIERNDSAVLLLINSLEEVTDDIINGLTELCIKKGCITTLSHISRFIAERNVSE